MGARRAPFVLSDISPTSGGNPSEWGNVILNGAERSEESLGVN